MSVEVCWGLELFPSLHSCKFTCALCSESLRQTNLAMKERFEGLAAWREKQQEERDFLESRLKEARDRMEALACQNQELSGRAGEDGKPGGAAGGSQVRKS